MRPPVLAALLLLGPLGVAAGRDPAPPLPPPTLATATPSPAAVYPSDGLLPDRPTTDPTRWRADLVVGLPTALRVQVRVLEPGGWVEGGVSAYGPVPGVFAGLRCDARLVEGRRDLLLVRPGVDAYYSPLSGDGGFLFPAFHGLGAVVADVDVGWHRRWSDGFHSSVGVKFGCGVAAGGNAVFPIPVLGLVFGCQF